MDIYHLTYLIGELAHTKGFVVLDKMLDKIIRGISADKIKITISIGL